MKDELDTELKELRRKRDLGKNSVDEAKLKQLCIEMELNETQSSLLFAHFQTGTHRATSKKKELDDNIGDKEITKEDSKPVKSFRIWALVAILEGKERFDGLKKILLGKTLTMLSSSNDILLKLKICIHTLEDTSRSTKLVRIYLYIICGLEDEKCVELINRQ